MRIDLFRSGTHTAMGGQTIAFSDADVAAIAAGYDASKHEAPIVVGHPKHDAPAYGWVSGLSFADGKLVADADQVDPAFAEMVGAGRFKKVSASFYDPDSAANPTPGTYHLRHVGFLGAQPPSVKGLQPVEFGEGDEGLVTIEFADPETASALRSAAAAIRGVRDWILGKFGQEEADKAVPAWTAQWMQEQATRLCVEADDNGSPAYAEGADTVPAGGGADTIEAGAADTIEAAAAADTIPAGDAADTVDGAAAASTVDAGSGADTVAAGGEPDAPLAPDAAATAFAEREALLVTEAQRLAAERVAFAEEQREARVARDGAELDVLVAAGKLAPGWRAPVANFLEKLDADGAVSFSEGSEAETPHAFMLRLLQSGGTVIDFGEAAPASRKAPSEATPAARASAISARVEERRAAGRPISFAEAAAQITSEESDT